ncbi:MAG: DegV family protein, partial [Clostridiales bacterium]|nr:DegV family protein [Clostridiales bacterium]
MIKILTDSSCVIPMSEAEELGIEMIPLGITFGSEAYKDGVDITTEQFYAKLLEGTNYPHTSQPSPQELEDHFAKAKAEGVTLLFLPLSSKISGTYESALRVKEMGGFDNVYVYDTLCTTIMLELLVREAAKRTHLKIDELIDYVDKLRKRAKLYAGIDTLEFLAKGGRLNTATAAIGSLLKVKPLITISSQGTIDVIGK